jgi:hypothetical protein
MFPWRMLYLVEILQIFRQQKNSKDFSPLFYFVMQALCKTKNAPKGGFLGHTIFIYKMFRKSLTCADFMVIICRVIRA